MFIFNDVFPISFLPHYKCPGKITPLWYTFKKSNTKVIMSALISTITSKGQVTIPKNVRDSLHLFSGDKVEFIRNESNEIIIKPLTKKSADVAGMLSKYRKDHPVAIEEMDKCVKMHLKKKFDEGA